MKALQFVKCHFNKLLVGSLLGICMLLALGLAYTNYIKPISQQERTLVKVAFDKNELSPMRAGDVYEQSFCLQNVSMEKLNIFMQVTSIRDESQIVITLKNDDTNEEIQQWTMAQGTTTSDGQYRSFLLNVPLTEENTGNYSFTIEAKDLIDGDNIALTSTRVEYYSMGTFWLNGEEQVGDLYFQVKGGTNGFLAKAFALFVAAVLLLGVILYLALVRFKWPLHKIFLIFALFNGVFYMIIMPPYSANDEQSHFCTAYYYSSEFMGLEPEDEEGYVLVRAEDTLINYSQMNPDLYTYSAMANHLFTPPENTDMVSYFRWKLDTPATAYPAQIIGITIARWLNLSNVMLLQLGSFLGLLLYVGLCTYAVYKIPFGKMVLVVLALVPTSMLTAPSFSYDGLTTALSFVFIAYTLWLAYAAKKVRIGDWIFLSVILAWLAPIKTIYVLIGFLCFLIPVKKAGGIKKFLLGIAAELAVGGGSILLVQFGRLEKVVSNSAAQGTYAENTGTYNTISGLLSDPLHFIRLCYNTLENRTSFYFRQLFGWYPEWNKVEIPLIILVCFFVILILAVLWNPEDTGELDKKGRTVSLLVSLGMLGSLFLVFAVVDTHVSDPMIFGIQGRYFIPVLPVALLLLRNRVLTLRHSINRELIMSLYTLHFFTLLFIIKVIVAR